MLRSATELKTFAMKGADGEVGRLRDVYFDDLHWTVRYLVVETGGLLHRHRVLIAPEAVHEAAWDDRILSVGLTREQVERSPGLDWTKPISRDYETTLRTFHGWPAYWGAAYGDAPMASVAGSVKLVREHAGDRHLFNTNSVTGYVISTSDGQIGSVGDFLIDDATWAIRCFIVDTGTWLRGRQVVLAPDWIVQVSWSAGSIEVDVPREAIRNSPAYNARASVSPEYLAELHDYYRRPERERSEAVAGPR